MATDWTQFSVEPSDDVSSAALISAQQPEEQQFEENLSPLVSNPLEALDQPTQFEELHSTEKETLFAGGNEIFLQEPAEEAPPAEAEPSQAVQPLQSVNNMEDVYRGGRETENFYSGGRWV